MAILGEFTGLLAGLRDGSYPKYLTTHEVGNEIPVFLYHRTDPIQLEAQLAFLADNQYVTLTAEEHYWALTHNDQTAKQSIVLTVDDGLKDLYEVAFPLLKQYKIKMVAFVITGRVGMPGMANWDELREMDESGFVDIQSHSLNHAAIPISSEITDFYNPDFRFFHPWDVPVDSGWRSKSVPEIPAYGRPIFARASRLGDLPRFIPASGLEEDCALHVQASGNERFFSSKRWRPGLQGRVKAFISKDEAGRFETKEDQRNAIEAELVESRNAIESRLNKQVRHLAYPWNEYGKLVREILKEAGYLSAYAGQTRVNGPETARDRMYELGRITGDFVLCLPGRGHHSLARMLVTKAKRRLTKGLVY